MMTPEEWEAVRERANNEPLDVSLANQHRAERDRAALLAEVERLREDTAELEQVAKERLLTGIRRGIRLDKVRDVVEWIRDSYGDPISRDIEERLRSALDPTNG